MALLHSITEKGIHDQNQRSSRNGKKSDILKARLWQPWGSAGGYKSILWGESILKLGGAIGGQKLWQRKKGPCHVDTGEGTWLRK